MGSGLNVFTVQFVKVPMFVHKFDERKLLLIINWRVFTTKKLEYHCFTLQISAMRREGMPINSTRGPVY